MPLQMIVCSHEGVSSNHSLPIYILLKRATRCCDGSKQLEYYISWGLFLKGRNHAFAWYVMSCLPSIYLSSPQNTSIENHKGFTYVHEQCRKERCKLVDRQ
ncbi:hypothetical protein ABZP36_019883 [Zizania latifolia]